MKKPKSKRPPSTAQQLARMDRRITAMHSANVKQNTAAALDLGALTINVNQLLELKRKQDEQMSRIVGLMTTLVERDRILRNFREANSFIDEPLKSRVPRWQIGDTSVSCSASDTNAFPERSGAAIPTLEERDS